MSFYAGFSLKEVYKKRCADLQCAANSAVVKLLSDVPDDFTSLTSLDLSRNFLGTKGVVPLLDVVECAKLIRNLDLRNQELGNEAVTIICARLRRHPSLEKLNLSDNPITLAVGSNLLDLAKNNPVLQYILLERTLVRPSMVTAIEVQLEKNRQRAQKKMVPAPRSTVIKAASTSPSSLNTADADTTDTASVVVSQGSTRSPTTDAVASPTASGGGAAAVTVLSQKTSRSPRAKAAARKRYPPHEIQHVLRTYTHTVSDVLFDVDPTGDLWDWCEDRHYFFDDDQFSSRNEDLHRTSRHTYGIAGWRRVGELYPQATLFGNKAALRFCTVSDEHHHDTMNENATTSDPVTVASGLLPEANSLFVQLPTDIPEGFTWIFTSVVASVRGIDNLHELLCCPRTGSTAATAATANASSSPPRPPLAQQRGTEFPGIYAMRLHVEGKWRYLIVDDFLPVDKLGRLVFTKPALNGTAFWPCILEKMLAKLYGGYHVLDSNFDEHRVGIDGPSIRRPIAWNYLSRENLKRVAGGLPSVESPLNENVAPSSIILEWLSSSCGRIMSQFTNGFYESYRLHPLEENVKGKWWDVLLSALPQPRHSNFTPAGTALHPDGEGNLHQGFSLRQYPTYGGSGQMSIAAKFFANAALAGGSSLHTGVVAFSRDAAHTSNGIHAHTAYQVLRAFHANGVRLLMLRNPWCRAQKWSGDWADDSPLWKKYPEIAGALLQRSSTYVGDGGTTRGLSEAAAYIHGDNSLLTRQSNLKRSLLTAIRNSGGGGGDGGVAEAHPSSQSIMFVSGSGDGGSGGIAHVAKATFWMSYTDFLLNFDWVHLCHVFGDEFYRHDIHSEWTCETAGGNPQEPSWHSNPHYRLMLPYRTTVRLQLNRRSIGFSRLRASVLADTPQRGEGGIGLQVIRDASYPLHCRPPLDPRDRNVPIVLNGYESDGARRNASGEEGLQDRKNLALPPFPVVSPPFSTVIFSAGEQVGDHLTADLVLDADTQYWIIPTTHTPRTLDHFDLTVVAPASFQVQEVAESQYWDTRTTPPELLVASSVPLVCQGDDELAILINVQTRVFVDAAAVLMQAANKKRMKELGSNDTQVETSSEGAVAPLAQQQHQQSMRPCRIVVTATMEVVDNDDEMGDFGVDEAYEWQLRQGESFAQEPSVSLAVVPGEVDSAGNPSRTIRQIDPLPSCIYALGQSAVLETEVVPTAEHEVGYYTAICSPRPVGTRTLISYQVWCAAPLLEVRSLPKWAKQEITVGWDDERGSGNFYDCDGHPQIELTELQPYQRFTVGLRMVDYDTIVPAIMFSVINAGQTGEPISGRLADNELYARSEYVDSPEVQASFNIGKHVPASLLLIPCLQPTGSHGRCVVTISSDSEHFRARALCGDTQQ